MPSPDAVLRAIERLHRNIRSPDKPSIQELPELAADWADLLGDVEDAELDEAVRAWLRGSTPFWPTPGQLVALTGFAPNPKADRARLVNRGHELFPVVCKLRGSLGASGEGRLRVELRYHGVPLDEEVAGCIAGYQDFGGWKHFEPGDPNRGGDQRRYDSARRRFAEAFADAAGSPTRVAALLPPPAPVAALPPPSPPPPAPVAARLSAYPDGTTQTDLGWDERRRKAHWGHQSFHEPAPSEAARQLEARWLAQQPAKPAVAPTPPSPPAPKIIEQWHVTAGWFRPHEIGQAFPADWEHPRLKDLRAKGSGFKPPFGGGS